MASKNQLNISPDELFGAVRASQFVLAELALCMGAGHRLRDRIVRLEESLLEHGLVSTEDGEPVATREQYPLLFQGMQNTFQSLLVMIEARLPSEDQLELFPRAGTGDLETDSTPRQLAVKEP